MQFNIDVIHKTSAKFLQKKYIYNKNKKHMNLIQNLKFNKNS